MTVAQAWQLAIDRYRAGQLADAETLCRQILQADASHAEAANLLWTIVGSTGRSEEALDLVERAIERFPGQAVYHRDRGVILRQLGRYHEAVASHRRSLELAPNSAETHLKLADAWQAAGRLDEANGSLRQALTVDPRYAEAHNNLGNVLAEQEQWEEAVGSFEAAIALHPSFSAAQINLARVLLAMGRTEESLAGSQRAVALEARSPAAQNQLGNSLAAVGRDGDAIEAYRAAIALAPQFTDAWTNLGNVYLKQCRWAEAESAYRTAIAHRPADAFAHLNLALLLLRVGNYAEGWREYEWRLRYGRRGEPQREFTVPQWDGGSAEGKTILLHVEQGFGDTLQFLRYVPVVAERSRAGKIWLECPRELERLVRHTAGWKAEVFVPGQTPEPAGPEFDLHLPLPSLPLALQIFEPEQPALLRPPYLRVDAAWGERWRERLGRRQGWRVGLVWAGSRSHVNDRQRSIDVAFLAPLLATPEVTFYGLQMDRAGGASVAGLGDLTPEITDFADTAAILAELDLVITVDTAMAHLAGALGRPVWVLLASVPDWRWGLEREDSPWYPSARLFRQTAAGDWEGVLRQVTSALRDEVARSG